MTGPALPALISPMLAALGVLPTGPGWGYEFKWDGVRAITYVQPGRVWVVSRNDRDVTATYPELGELTTLLPRRQAILDGEIVAVDPAGRPSFAQLQRRMHVMAPPASLIQAVPVRYYVFDVLRLDGRPVLHLPYQQRRELLAGLPLGGTVVQVPGHQVDVDPVEVSAAAVQRGLEGVVAKRLASPYRPGRRSPDWIKAPVTRTQDVVIIGYKPGAGRRAGTIGSLALAVHNPDGTLAFAGGVGTGFTHAMLTQLQRQLAAWNRATAPVPDIPREHARGVQWVEPVYVGEVAFRTWTPDGHLRHPSWRGLRPDRTPADARREPPPATVAVPGVVPAVVDGSMRTPDGRWQVDVMRRDDRRWYRIRHGDNIIDDIGIDDVEAILGAAGVDISDLTDTTSATGQAPDVSA